MAAEEDIRRLITGTLDEWIGSEGISQTEAARRLGLTQPALCAYLKGTRKAIGIETLLDAWKRVGGTWELKLGREAPIWVGPSDHDE